MRTSIGRGPAKRAVLAAALAAVCAATSAGAADGLAGRRLHLERDNTTDGRVPGPVNQSLDITINAIDREAMSYTISSVVTHVGGAVGLRMVTHVRIPFSQVYIFRGGDLVAFQCKDGSRCIPWSVETYFNENATVAAPVGGMEIQSTIGLTGDAAALDEIQAQLCTLTECRK